MDQGLDVLTKRGEFDGLSLVYQLKVVLKCLCEQFLTLVELSVPNVDYVRPVLNQEAYLFLADLERLAFDLNSCIAMSLR